MGVHANECLNCLNEKLRMSLVSTQEVRDIQNICLPRDDVCDQKVGGKVEKKDILIQLQIEMDIRGKVTFSPIC